MKGRITSSFFISAIAAVVLIVLLTIIGDLYKPLKEWLAAAFTHHWIGKSVLSFAGFLAVGLLLSALPRSLARPQTLLVALVWTVLIGTALLVGFYYYEAFLVPHA